MPAAAAMSSRVVSTNPLRMNRSRAICSSSARLVTGGRPSPWSSRTPLLLHRVQLLCPHGHAPFLHHPRDHRPRRRRPPRGGRARRRGPPRRGRVHRRDVRRLLIVSVLDAAWDLAPQVSVRPERFGALLYHFGTRRLSFLKDRRLLAVAERAGEPPTARGPRRRARG